MQSGLASVLVDGVSQRTAAREFGVSRKSVRKMVAFSVPPGYRREQPVKRPKQWDSPASICEDDQKRVGTRVIEFSEDRNHAN